MPPSDRYSRQILFRDIGEAGQERIRAGRVLLCGCGALGSAIADGLTRAGVGFLRIVDRDFVELSNLQRQVLFDEQDIADQLPKTIAAARKLAKINSDVTIEPIVADIDHTNILKFIHGDSSLVVPPSGGTGASSESAVADRLKAGLRTDVDIILDGMDNFETRFLINDAALETGLPWVYGGCIGSHGQVMPIIPGETACLRCLIGDVPDPGMTETCDTAGVLGPAVNVVAALQVVAALKFLAGRRDLIEPSLTIVDVWDSTLRKMSVANLRERADCPACAQGKRDWLSGNKGSQTTILCGRNAVQISPAEKRPLSLSDLAGKLRGVGEVTHNQFLLRLKLPPVVAGLPTEPQSPTACLPDAAGDLRSAPRRGQETRAEQDSTFELTIFPDGRAIIKGTDDITVARSLYARYVGT